MPRSPEVLNAFRHHGLYRMVNGERSARGLKVLNAFRHHGLYRLRHPSGYFRRRHLEVLNAFRHHGLYRERPVPAWMSAAIGAQRLSASRIISVRRSRKIDELEVLNAFRHHGLYRVLRFGTRHRSEVLNAFRHHGLYRRECVLCGYTEEERCSTPFGITDYIGVGHGDPGAHPPWCSTPFGITDYIGTIACSPGRLRVGAQRLSASRIISGAGNLRILRYFYNVLNAFRHHGLYRMSTSLYPSFRVTVGAQRLSASRIISAARTALGLDDPDKCSTPFGITDYIGSRG